MAFGNVCELKGWKYQSHQIDNLNNSYEIEFWEIGLLHAGFQSVWLWMNDIWVTLESLVVKDCLSLWTQKNGERQPLYTCGHTVNPQHGFMSFVAVLWAGDFTVSEVVDHNKISNVFLLYKYEVSCYILPDCSYIERDIGVHIYCLILFLGPHNVKEMPYQAHYSYDCTYKLWSSAECRCEIKRGA